MIEADKDLMPLPCSNINTYSFIKEDEQWHLDLPQYLERGGDIAALRMVDGAAEILRTMARSRSKVNITIDTKPFEGADLLELKEICEAPSGGGYYIMHTCRGKAYNKKMWLCDILLFIFGDIPSCIYVRKASQQFGS